MQNFYRFYSMNSEKKIPGTFGHFEMKTTGDGTKTLWSSYYDEHFHNQSGALEETLYTYCQHTHIERCFHHFDPLNPFSILEVGYGTGSGLYGIFHYLLSQKNEFTQLPHPKIYIEYVSFELDEELIHYLRNQGEQDLNLLSSIHPPLREWDLLTQGPCPQLKISKELSLGNEMSIGFRGTIFIGNGRKIFQLPEIRKTYQKSFHSIFQDAFSPGKNPELWTVEWFKDLSDLSANDVLLSTYSSSTRMRLSLHESEWWIFSPKGHGVKKRMTVAKKNLAEGELPDQIVLEKLTKSPQLPLYDRDLKYNLLKS